MFRPTSVLHSIVFSVLNTCTYKIRYSEWDPNLHPHFTSGDIFILCNTFSEPTFWLSLPHKASRGIPRLGHVTARRLGNFRGIFFVSNLQVRDAKPVPTLRSHLHFLLFVQARASKLTQAENLGTGCIGTASPLTLSRTPLKHIFKSICVKF